MSKRAEAAAMEAYPPTYTTVKRHAKRVQSELVDTHQPARAIFQRGYEQAEKDTIERACQLLYDYNKLMAEIFGAKAVLIDVERFRKTLIIEEE